jgi:lactoylglutathione lyase
MTPSAMRGVLNDAVSINFWTPRLQPHASPGGVPGPRRRRMAACSECAMMGRRRASAPRRIGHTERFLYMLTGIHRGTELTMAQTVAIEGVDHIGIRVRDLDRALAFYRTLGFTLAHRAVGDDVAILRNEHGVELNLIFNANASDPAGNILMDVPDKFPGYTHIALRVASIPATIAALRANGIAITQGPVSFGESGQVSVFVRDPDRNTIELRGREQGLVEGVTRYVP